MMPKEKGVRFVTASGQDLAYHGKKNVRFRPAESGGRGSTCNMEFHVTNSTKPLASAAAVVKAGNRVVLDPEGSYIENRKTGERIRLKESKGTYVFEVVQEVVTRASEVGFTMRG